LFEIDRFAHGQIECMRIDVGLRGEPLQQGFQIDDDDAFRQPR
jgi:hypothetical protein